MSLFEQLFSCVCSLWPLIRRMVWMCGLCFHVMSQKVKSATFFFLYVYLGGFFYTEHCGLLVWFWADCCCRVRPVPCLICLSSCCLLWAGPTSCPNAAADNKDVCVWSQMRGGRNAIPLSETWHKQLSSAVCQSSRPVKLNYRKTWPRHPFSLLGLISKSQILVYSGF